MSKERHSFKKLVVSSFDVQFTTNLSELAETIRVPKKVLRRAYWIRRQERFECEIIEKRKLVKRTFVYGFRKFIKKEEHKDREILAPHPDVQSAFKAIQKWLEQISSSHPRAYGFVKKRNPKKAVQALLRKQLCEKENKHFFRFDISDAFPSIGMEMVMAVFKKMKVDASLIMPLSWFVTYYYDGQRRLPQGGSCSPSILNRVYKPMCKKVDEVCKEHGIRNWAVYADDFNFAAPSISDEVKQELLAIPQQFGFQAKPSKTRDNRGKTVPHMLGLTVVRGQIHLNNKRKDKFRMILFAAAKGHYSHERVMGTVSAIRQVYGAEKKWPGWLLKPWRKYQLRREVEVWMGLEKTTGSRLKTSRQSNQCLELS